MKVLELEEIYERYIEGESIVDIAKEKNITHSTIYRNFKKKNYKVDFKRKGYGLSLKKEVALHYKENQLKDTCTTFKISDEFVLKCVREFEFELKGKGHSRKPFDISKFKEKEGQYIIGYILGDGCVVNDNNNRQYHVTTVSIDYDTLSIFQNFFGDYMNVYNIEPHDNNKLAYMMRINDKYLIEYLISIGITPRKSDNCELKIDYNWDILRGYFDADGSVRKLPRKEIKITSNSHKSLNQIFNFTKIGKVMKRSKSKTNDWLVYRKEDIQYIFENMYYENCCKMQRKYNIIESYIKNY